MSETGGPELMTGIENLPAEVAGDGDLAAASSAAFERLPPEMIVRAFGVTYGHVHSSEGGDLYVTRYGWPFLAQLLPANWYAEQRYSRQGTALPGSGHVYRVSTQPVAGRSIDIVVKFSRVAREVALEVASTFPDDFPAEIIANARFNSPMEEFGLVMELRRGAYGPDRRRVLTQRPLAIYAPPEEFELWQLGRDQSRFDAHWHLLAQDQGNAPKAIELDIKRVYVLVYEWIKGEDAEEALRSGEISEPECNRLTLAAIHDLRGKGFRVLDNKPKHFILRKRPSDQRIMRRRDGNIVYALVDFELLQRTAEHQSRFKAAQREKYWHLQAHRLEAPAPAALPSRLKRTTIFGVDYVFGTTPNGGKLWVVGYDGELFDYFLPDRWRRTPRTKLSDANEVYHTRTRDGIHVVYRMSRVGRPATGDSLADGGERTREHGYNSPFEEVAIAVRLRKRGVLSSYPRAVYRTGHRSNKAESVSDRRRFDTHASLMTPEKAPEPLLSPDYDYYTIWGYYRGVDPEIEHRRCAVVTDLEQAWREGLVGNLEYEDIVRTVRSRLRDLDLGEKGDEASEFAVSVGEDGIVRRDAHRAIDVSLCVDAQTAYEHRLIGEQAYQSLLRRLEERLAIAGARMLNVAGHHLLLSMHPDGRLNLDEDGQPAVVVCNFEFIRDVPDRGDVS
ncbi:MAG: hypothetical protein HY899_00625 [Deltaproteobacteria bacterium]|nr:hypothetical protein [Deltaproteobacteria bacterium]